jgi:hypothetical protein
MVAFKPIYIHLIVGFVLLLIGIIDWLFVAGKAGHGTCEPNKSLAYLLLACLLALFACVGGAAFVGSVERMGRR